MKRIVYSGMIGWLVILCGFTPSILAEDMTRVVMIGSDRRANESGESDSTLIMSYNQQAEHITLITLPQDLVISLPTGDQTIAQIYTLNQDQGVVQALQEWSGITLEDYFTIDLSGVGQIIDDIGDISIQSLDTFDQDGYHFQQGQSLLLNKEKALSYMRYTSTEPSKATRQDRQKQVLQAIGERLGEENLSAFGYMKLYQTYSRYLDSSLTKAQMINIAKQLMKSSNRITYYCLDSDATPQQLQKLLQ